MNNRQNYYRILHVQPDAPLEIIKSSYRTLMHRLNQHPDRGGDHNIATMINEAYRVLSDPSKRARYDLAFKNMSANQTSFKDHARRKTERKNHDAPRFYNRGEAARKGGCAFCMTPYPVSLRNEPYAECPVCRSPLYEARRLLNSKSSKRSIERITHYEKMAFYSCWPQKSAYQGLIRDLSPQGLQFLSRTALAKDQIIKLDGDTLHATCRIACCLPKSDADGRYYRIGAEFLTLRFNRSRGTFVSEEV